MATAATETPAHLAKDTERNFEYKALKDVQGLKVRVVLVEGRMGSFGPEVMIWAYLGMDAVCITNGSRRLVSLYEQGKFTAGLYRFVKGEFPPGWIAERIED